MRRKARLVEIKEPEKQQQRILRKPPRLKPHIFLRLLLLHIRCRQYCNIAEKQQRRAKSWDKGSLPDLNPPFSSSFSSCTSEPMQYWSAAPFLQLQAILHQYQQYCNTPSFPAILVRTNCRPCRSVIFWTKIGKVKICKVSRYHPS